jgi:hypothetical protein
MFIITSPTTVTSYFYDPYREVYNIYHGTKVSP